MRFGDGLGWARPICLCASTTNANFTSPAGNTSRNPTRTGLLPLHELPGQRCVRMRPVFSDMGMRGQIVDDEAMRSRRTSRSHQARVQSAGRLLHHQGRPCHRAAAAGPLEPARVRLKAAEMIGDIGESEPSSRYATCVSPMKSSTRKSRSHRQDHERYFTGSALSAPRSSSAGPAFASIAQEVAGNS